MLWVLAGSDYHLGRAVNINGPGRHFPARVLGSCWRLLRRVCHCIHPVAGSGKSLKTGRFGQDKSRERHLPRPGDSKREQRADQVG